VTTQRRNRKRPKSQPSLSSLYRQRKTGTKVAL
jgi:hypothetical protein